MRVFVEDWAAAYGSAYLVLPDDPGSASAALVEDGETLRAHLGRVPSGDNGPIAFVDGVRRGEASLYQHDPATGALTRGVAGGHACGCVIARSGSPLEFGITRIRRLIIWGGGLTAKLPEVSRGWAWIPWRSLMPAQVLSVRRTSAGSEARWISGPERESLIEDELEEELEEGLLA